MILWYLITLLIVLWLCGWAIHFGGVLIHVLIVIALILLVLQLITRRREE